MSAQDTAPLLQWNTSSIIYSISVSRDANRVVSGSSDCFVRIWDIHTGSLILEPLKGHSGWVRSVAWSHDDERIVSGSIDGSIRMWDARTGDPIGEWLTGHTDGVYSVAFSPDGTCLVSGSRDNTIRMWDVGSGACIGEPLRRHTSPVFSVAFSPNSTRIVSGSQDHTIGIWDAQTGAPLGELLKGHTGTVYSVMFSPDNSRIVSGSFDKTIGIWDASTGAPVGELLRGHTSIVQSVAFSPDSTRIVSGSFDAHIRVWDARTGDPIGEPLRGHTNVVHSVMFSSDGTRIISGSSDKTICVWKVPEKSPSDIVTSSMSAQEMFDALVNHGCTDLSFSLDSARYSTSAIASGGFGDIWQAWMNSGILVAVKCLRLHTILEGDPKGMKRTTRELYHWSKAKHHNVQELLGIVMFRGRLGMVSLWMHNGNLQQYIEKNPGVERYPLCVQVAKGVEYMHGIGMIHGDLKAVNILVSADGIAKISDFDYSMLSESTLRFSQTIKAGGGTLRWMAPELLLHQEDDDPPVARNVTTDIYALGMTMLEIISGNVPYHQYQYDVGIFHALVKKQPPKRPQELLGPEEQSTRIWALLLRCWDHDPAARPDASWVLTSLQCLLSE